MSQHRHDWTGITAVPIWLVKEVPFFAFLSPSLQIIIIHFTENINIDELNTNSLLGKKKGLALFKNGN